ncbi:HAD superfamily hydrolase (TIGR01509 family)/beta-phosphoglucomutase family hydrolase [Actinocorallia herbida]|uniref:Beta-phosphoglucomutase n=1 Tax=Actinocorallia herbida TaxID=58109 RepID=A0A3N1D7D5_9ACTN|nr:beta-phosphoglucomutase family hydrolase [Actinocorallia herbida]ROO89443.1 HAD superfamily hydrolase (TIGR01509 family)/beta-phosphoglucomutase family hydrolase [Actinocorallia herbida]
MLALPDEINGFLFDLDGVVTDTAAVHAAAWKRMFDTFLAERNLDPFKLPEDYTRFVDGKKREDGTRSFLESRGVVLPDGDPDDPPEAETVYGLGNRKNALVLTLIAEDGVAVFPDAVALLERVRAAGGRTALVSSSANAEAVLEAVGLTGLFDARIDGVTARERGLPGKPAPDMFLAGAEAVGLPPSACAAFEDALAGVAAGRAGGFALVVGVDRVKDGAHGPSLAENGADVVVTDLRELVEQQ